MKKAHFFIRIEKPKCKGLHRIGIIAMQLGDGILEISGSICSPKDKFSPKLAIQKAYGRLIGSDSDHVITTIPADAILWSFKDLVESKLGFRNNRYGSPLHCYNGRVNYEKHTDIYRSVIDDLLNNKLIH